MGLKMFPKGKDARFKIFTSYSLRIFAENVYTSKKVLTCSSKQINLYSPLQNSDTNCFIQSSKYKDRTKFYYLAHTPKHTHTHTHTLQQDTHAHLVFMCIVYQCCYNYCESKTMITVKHVKGLKYIDGIFMFDVVFAYFGVKRERNLCRECIVFQPSCYALSISSKLNFILQYSFMRVYAYKAFRILSFGLFTQKRFCDVIHFWQYIAY